MGLQDDMSLLYRILFSCMLNNFKNYNYTMPPQVIPVSECAGPWIKQEVDLIHYA